MSEEARDRVVTDLRRDVNGDDLDSLVFDLSKYQHYSDDAATVVYAYTAGQLGVVLWNLEPGQENEYHVHPTTEHLHVVVAGECEYTIGDREPKLVRTGQAVMIPEKIAHGIRNVGTSRASYIAITSPGRYEKVLVERPCT